MISLQNFLIGDLRQLCLLSCSQKQFDGHVQLTRKQIQMLEVIWENCEKYFHIVHTSLKYDTDVCL